MKFAIVDPKKGWISVEEHPDLYAAMATVGLKAGQIDFGCSEYNPAVNDKPLNVVGYVVYEYGFFVPKAEQYYWAIGRVMLAGVAVFYREIDGALADIGELPVIRFLGNGDGAEAAICRGEVDRPRTAINGRVIWEWPAQPDARIAEAMQGREES